MRRPVFTVLATALLAACTALHEPAANPDPNHTHADFAVYIDGRQLDFSDPQYMSAPPPPAPHSIRGLPGVPPASAHEDEDEAEGGELPGRKYLHLHDGNGRVIHRHKPGLTLADFFRSIGFTLTDTCLTLDTGTAVCADGPRRWRMFVKGEEHPLQAAYDFRDLDRILLTYGASDADVRRELDALTADACRYSLTCPERGQTPAENCIADPAVPCVAP